MNNNVSKLIVFIVSILLLIFIVIYFSSKVDRTEQSKIDYSDYRNATYSIDDSEVKLNLGLAKYDTNDGASKVVTRYFGNEVKADFDLDGNDDVAFIVTQDGGGSGTFYYVAVALGSKNGYIGKNAIFLGDRIAPQTTEFRNGKIIVNFADRKINEPMTSSPSVGVSKYFRIVDGKLKEEITDMAI
jgi:hypothetical protein